MTQRSRIRRVRPLMALMGSFSRLRRALDGCNTLRGGGVPPAGNGENDGNCEGLVERV